MCMCAACWVGACHGGVGVWWRELFFVCNTTKHENREGAEREPYRLPPRKVDKQRNDQITEKKEKENGCPST